MHIPNQIISKNELHKQNGEKGARKWVAFNGVVYDVTNCPKWKLDLHEQLHFPGQDLSGELEEAPHQEEVFTRPCIKIIGIFKDE